MTKMKWDRFADTVMSKLAGIQPGEVVLIVADTDTDLDVAHAYLSAAVRAGADAGLHISRYRTRNERDVPKSLEAAVLASDVILGLSRSGFSHTDAARRARAERGARLLMTNTHQGDYLYDGVLGIDYDKMLENVRLYSDLLREANHVRVADEQFGVDIEFDLGDRPVVPGPGAVVGRPGEIDFYPGAQVSIAPIEESINGTTVSDASLSGQGVLTEPVFITVENGVITNVEGGFQARQWKEWLDSRNDPMIYRLCHFSVGFNPAARITGNFMQDERVVACVDFGFGSQDPIFKGAVGVGSWHTDTLNLGPAIYFDGKLIAEKNRFNPDLGFH